MGQIDDNNALSLVKTVHPHACGADEASETDIMYHHRFTPTHVGQIAAVDAIAEDIDRFTPTHVGQMFKFSVSSDGHYGSPPRMWGRCNADNQAFNPDAVHPHACGADERAQDQEWRLRRFTPTHVGQMALR